MATKTLIRTGASLLNRLVSSKPNTLLVHQSNTAHHHQFPSLSKIQTSLYLPSSSDSVSLTRVASQGFLYPSGLPSLEFYLPNGIFFSVISILCLFVCASKVLIFINFFFVLMFCWYYVVLSIDHSLC